MNLNKMEYQYSRPFFGNIASLIKSKNPSDKPKGVVNIEKKTKKGNKTIMDVGM
jgi:hypothetical protein